VKTLLGKHISRGDEIKEKLEKFQKPTFKKSVETTQIIETQ
jgi:hypothetical protein